MFRVVNNNNTGEMIISREFIFLDHTSPPKQSELKLSQAMAPKRVQSRTSKRDTPDILSAAILKVRRGRGFNMSVLAFMFSRFLRLEP